MAALPDFISDIADLQQRGLGFAFGDKRPLAGLPDEIAALHQIPDGLIGRHPADAEIACELFFRRDLLMYRERARVDLLEQIILDLTITGLFGDYGHFNSGPTLNSETIRELCSKNRKIKNMTFNHQSQWLWHRPVRCIAASKR
jgi:hypothetical protein